MTIIASLLARVPSELWQANLGKFFMISLIGTERHVYERMNERTLFAFS